MKNKIDRLKTATARFSTRAIAMMLFFVMLLTAIGSGSVLSAIATETNGGVSADALQTAADKALGIAEDALNVSDDNEIVRDKGDLADTGANADLAGTGYTADEFAVEGSWDDYKTHKMYGSTGYTQTFTETGTFGIQFKAENPDRFWADNVTITDSIHDYYMQKKTGSTSMQIYIPRTGNYVFKCTGLDGNGTSPKFQIDYPEDTSPITWTVAGDNTTLFGTPTWDETKDANNLALQSGGTYDGKYTKSWSNVYLKKGDIKFKVLKNHAWTTAYPSSNKVVTIPSAGYYNVVVVYDDSDHSVNMVYEEAATYTFTLGSTDHATVTATYGSTTVNEGGFISSVPGGVDVNISVTPDSGYKATGVSTSPDATVTGSGESWTVTMPTDNVTATATVDTYKAPTKRVYFYNKFTQYPMVTIYAYHKESDEITDEIFGPNGRTMNKMDNSDLWYIDLPDDAYIVFKGEGYSTGELAPLKTHDTSPKYIPGPTKTTPGTGGYWGEYLARNNVYSVSDGTTMSANNLYTSINATFFDYYVDSEVTNGWLTGITSDSDYNGYTHDTNNDPYRNMLNKALSDYADNDTETSSGNIVGGPANNITYPLYWGNNPSTVATLHNFNIAANNSTVLDPPTTAIQGLAGDKLTGNIIHHYKNGVTDNNGAAMAFFDEDFLSGNNSLQKALATILHSPSFPVRKEDEKTLCLDLSSHDGGWESGTTYIAANFYNTNTNDDNALRVLMTKVADHKYTVSVPSGYTKVEWLKFGSADISGTSTYYKSAGEFSTNDTYAFTGGTGSSVAGSWSTDATIGKGHTYYEYDSTNGKDNAFITDIDTTAHTALLNYYDSSKDVKVKSNIGHYGFFPFDYNNITSGGYDVKRIYLDLNGNFSLDYSPKFYAYFFGSNTSIDQWVEMKSYNGSTSLYYCDIPTPYDYTKVCFTRNNGSSGWENKWDQTIDADIPSNTLEVVYYVYSEKDGDKYKGGWGTSQSVRVPRKVGSANGYADSNHVAHDQGFGMKLEIPFTLSANGLNDDLSAQVFEFSGDDDLWVYIDNNLVLDLGGAHGATRGSINFNTMKAIANNAVAISTAKDATSSSKASGTTLTKDFSSIINTKAANFNSNKIHTMTIYYMERGMYDSNLKFGYSFHAIDSLLQTEKKVRTRSDDANRKINAGFFIDNGLDDAASNMSGVYIDNGERQITKFEHSFQSDTFTITQNYPETTDLLAENHSITYTIGDAVTNVPNDGSENFTYNLHNDNDGDQIANFNGQFRSGTSINLKETINDAANKFRYDPSFTVYDDARTVSGSQKYEFISGDGSEIGKVHEELDGSYTFTFSPSVTKSGIEDLRLRARFTNQMKCHSLTLRKLINDTNTTATFTFKILFSFDNGESYISYPLELKSGGSLTNEGTISFKANESITMLGIPERALVKIIETGTTDTSYAYTGAEVTTVTGNDVPDTAEVTTGLAGTDLGGVQFTMADEDVDVDVKNANGEPVYISHSLLPASIGTGGTYVAAYVVNGAESDTLADVGGNTCSNIMTTNVIKIPKEFITSNSPNYLKIELQTYPDEHYEFIDFYEQITDTLRKLNATGSSPAYTVAVDGTNGVNKVTVRIAIRDLFNAKHAQLYTELPFYSALGAQLKITHKIDPSTPAAAITSPNGADTKVRARVKTPTGTVKDWYNGTSDEDWTYVGADGSLTIPAKYFWNNMVDDEGTHINNNILEVQLETTVYGFSQLKNVSLFGVNIPESGPGNDGETVRYTKDVANRKVHISVSYNIQNLFDGSTPRHTELPFLSLLEVPNYEYTFNYTYPAFISGYGNQTFTVHDKFSTAELEENMTFEKGKLIFKPDVEGEGGKKYASDFINAHAPYEDNFQKLVRISNYSHSESNPTDITYNVTMENKQEHFTVYMNLPYATDKEHDNDYDYVVTDGRVVQTPSHSEPYKNVFNKQWFTKNTQCRFPSDVREADPEHNKTENKPRFVAAPLIIYDGDTPRYFKYWQVETISQYNTSAREYTRCYDYEFNLALFQPCTITPIYSDATDDANHRATFADRGMPNPPTTYDMYSRFDPEVNRRWFVDTNAVTIAFLENSRNQYNNGNNGTGEAASTILSKRQGAADIIYSSFLMTFDSEYDGDKTVVLSEKYKDSPGVMECGLIFEGVAKLEGSDETGYTVQEDTYYANYAENHAGESNADKYAGMTTDHIKDVLEGNASFNNQRTIRAKLDVTALDNKNRIQYHYGIDAAKPHSSEEENANPLSALSKSGNKTYVYKAYAYIGKTTSTSGVLSDVKVSATPVYFTIYNDANISPGNTLDLPAGYSSTVE